MKIVFTMHAQARAKKRNIDAEEVIEAVRFPENTIKKKGKLYFLKRLDRGTIEVVCEKEKDIKVITVYWI
ncbi:TPA: DUF4258 domain-containing protein [Candidatus Woesearchaeota archaeon]|nr:DUF4258 domain-containing protein [Candidatus Woesearchaeota archaeon]